MVTLLAAGGNSTVCRPAWWCYLPSTHPSIFWGCCYLSGNSWNKESKMFRI